MDTKIAHAEIISPQHFEHTLWMNELKFFTDEVAIFEHQLEKLVKKRDRKMLAKLEQFQNNFIRQKEVLDQLKHDIKVHEQKVAWSYQNDQGLKSEFLKVHDNLQDEMETFRSIFKDLKKEFFIFLKMWK